MGEWIGVDFDGTLAQYDGWQGDEHLGDPVPAMVARVQKWLAEGREVRIFTARVAPQAGKEEPGIEAIRLSIVAWCREHIGQELEVTCIKDFGMVELWDDRCVQVRSNTGKPISGFWRHLQEGR